MSTSVSMVVMRGQGLPFASPQTDWILGSASSEAGSKIWRATKRNLSPSLCSLSQL